MSSSSTASVPILCASDVAEHASAESLWVSISSQGKVFDVTRLVDKGDEAGPLLARGGQDVSHWFDASGLSVRTRVDPLTNMVTVYTPEGRFPHIAPLAPVTDWEPDWVEPWWRDPAYVVGTLTARARKIQIVNTLTSHSHTLDVGCEQTVAAIAEKFLLYNAHARAYTWRALVDGKMRALDMEKTLEENGVADDTAELEKIGLDPMDPAMFTVILIDYDDPRSIA
jgi:hypothetical protein